MNTICQRCGAPNGSSILRQANGDAWLMLGADYCYYDADHKRYRLADVPKSYDQSQPMAVQLDLYLVRGTPMCLCQHCNATRTRRGGWAPKTKQRNFLHLLPKED